MNRRDFIKLIGTASGATIVTSCGLKKKTDKLIPYLVPPEDGVVPGQPIYSASTCTECPAGCGLLVNAREKLIGTRYERYPIKLEGAPRHPINDGALCIRGQSSLTRLYHPDRIRDPLIRDSKGTVRKTTWDEALRAVLEVLRSAGAEGQRSYYLGGRVTGSLSELLDSFCGEYGVERLPAYELFSHAAVRQANGILFGRSEIPRYRIDGADFLLTVGADILETHVSPVAYSLLFAEASKKEGFEWYHIEPHASLTGLRATRRLAVRPGGEAHLLAYLLRSLLDSGGGKKRVPEEVARLIPASSPEEVSRQTGIEAERLAALGEALSRASKPLVIAGGVSTGHGRGLETAVLAGLIQWAAGATEELADFSAGENYEGVGSLRDLETLSGRLAADKAGVVFVSNIKEVPKAGSLVQSLKQARMVVGLADRHEGLVKECDIVLPLSHALEAWGDAEPRRGLRTLVQPGLEPLHNTLSEGDILLRLLGESAHPPAQASYQAYLFARWKERMGEEGVRAFLEKGYREEAASPESVSLKATQAAAFLQTLDLEGGVKPPALILSPSIRAFDGRSADLPLLSEIPDPVSTISYGRWVSVSEATAKRVGLKDGGELELQGAGFSLRRPVRIIRSLPDDVYNVHIEAAADLPYAVDPRTGELVTCHAVNKVSKTGGFKALPILSGPVSFDEREIIPSGEGEHDRVEEHRVSLYPEHEHHDYRWAMAIDLDRCSGCSACVAACYMENNIPVVGPVEHLKGREMSWIRLEQHDGEGGGPQFMPMLCQHCDDAPCETVCPVYAAYHTDEGLNAQVYNRCVGTRYCSNNCPYKVRRFNWFEHEWPAPMDKMLNPDITVRGKGVMEKCTFCVQRIRAARDGAKDESRKIRDGEVTPACAQSCPTKAIVFGNILDEESKVHKMAKQCQSYRALESLGTEPAVYYVTKKTKKAKA